MTTPDDQRATASFLRALAGGDPVETHISLVFLGTDTVWKLKKAVRLSFLDFSTLAARRHYAERELALNAPHAPGMYRDVVPVVRLPDGSVGFSDDPNLPVMDWVLRMARVPAENFLDRIAAADELTPALLDGLADTVAAYHDALPPLPEARHDMRAVITGNVQAALDSGLPADRVRAWATAIEAERGGLEEWLDERAAKGFVRRAHGDLHLGNLCLWQGRPVPFDALEFDEALATIDIAYDLAFLLMDLDVRAGRAAANRVMNRYVARTGDAALVRGLRLFLSLRALIRAHVAARRGEMPEGLSYLDAASRYLAAQPAVLVAVGGLPGTGKSTLARAIAPTLGAAPGALVLRSDEIRKRLQGVAPEDRLPQSGYSRSVSRRVFEELGALAKVAAMGGQAVIADATFMAPQHRDMIARTASDAGIPFVGLWLTAPLAVLEARIAARTGDASDATVDVLRNAIRGDPGAGNWIAIDTTDATVARDLATAAIRPHVVLS